MTWTTRVYTIGSQFQLEPLPQTPQDNKSWHQSLPGSLSSVHFSHNPITSPHMTFTRFTHTHIHKPDTHTHIQNTIDPIAMMTIAMPSDTTCTATVCVTGVYMKSTSKSIFVRYSDIFKCDDDGFTISAIHATMYDRSMLVLTADGCLVHLAIDFTKMALLLVVVSKLPVCRPRAVSMWQDLLIVVGSLDEGGVEQDCVSVCEKNVMGEYQKVTDIEVPENLRTETRIYEISNSDNRLRKLYHRFKNGSLEKKIVSLLYVEGRNPNFTFRIADQGEPETQLKIHPSTHTEQTQFDFPTNPAFIKPLVRANNDPKSIENLDPWYLIVSECFSTPSSQFQFSVILT